MSAGEQLGAGNLTEDVDATPAGLVEQHHIGVIPESDRHGRPRDQFTLWFAANANVVNFTLGVLAIVFGLNLFWALVAIVVGNVLGMLLTALHAWQGPRLGVPQMIQSRGQFGFYGASFIILVSIVLDIGYLAASQVLQGNALNLLVSSISVQWWIIIITLPAVALAIFGGNVASTTLFAGLGAWIASLVPNGTSNPLGALAKVSGLWIMFFMGISQIPGDTLNAYTGMLAFASLGSNSKQFMAAQRRQAVRLTGILLIFVIGTVLACLNSKHFFSSFENFIGVLLFFFVPWSAINLVDYYLVKRGNYDVASFFTPDGIYGKFQWWACLCYVITLAVQVPFLDQTFYQGVLVPKLGGADISWIVGFGVASLLYLAGAKRFAGGRQAVPAAADPVGSAS